MTLEHNTWRDSITAQNITLTPNPIPNRRGLGGEVAQACTGGYRRVWSSRELWARLFAAEVLKAGLLETRNAGK